MLTPEALDTIRKTGKLKDLVKKHGFGIKVRLPHWEPGWYFQVEALGKDKGWKKFNSQLDTFQEADDSFFIGKSVGHAATGWGEEGDEIGWELYDEKNSKMGGPTLPKTDTKGTASLKTKKKEN